MVAFFGLLLFAGSFYFAWVAMAADLKRRSKGFLVRHLVGFVFANVVAGVVIALLSADNPAWWQWLLALVIAGGMFFQAKGGTPVLGAPTTAVRTEEHKTQAGDADQLEDLRQLCREMTADGTLDEEEIHTLHHWLASHQQVKRDALAQLLANHLDEVLADGQISVLESLDVLDLVEALAQGKSFADMQDWQALAPLIENEPPKVKRRPKKHSQSRVTGNRLDSIRFQYLNAAGEFSDRRVVVRVLDDEYFQGICQSRRAMRTFRLDRVQGDITSEESGEIANPYDWAAGIEVANKRIKT